MTGDGRGGALSRERQRSPYFDLQINEIPLKSLGDPSSQLGFKPSHHVSPQSEGF